MQEIWANADETHDNISLISYADWLGISPVISTKIHSSDVHRSLSRKVAKSSYFSSSRSFKVIDVGTHGKVVSSACCDKQQVCVYLQPFSR